MAQMVCGQMKYLQDEKTLQAESLKEIKHKTKCKVCQGEFKNRQVVRKSKTFLDELSDQSTLQPKALLEHEKISGHYYKYSCRHCGKSFSQKIQVEDFFKSFGGRLFGKSFLERFFTQMKRHEAQLHSSETPYQCRSLFDMFYARCSFLFMIKRKSSRQNEISFQSL